tara:strand:- start:61 stop:300 length:240 start_codon:yes stop_codon:yes gene_type:complete
MELVKELLLQEFLQVVVDLVVYKIGVCKQVKVELVVVETELLELILEVLVLHIVVEQTQVVVVEVVMLQDLQKEMVAQE